MTRTYYPATCARCGFVRSCKEYRTPLCGDCRLALTEGERAEWLSDRDKASA